MKFILLKKKFAALGDLSIKLSPPYTPTQDKVRSGREKGVRPETYRTTRASKINQEKLKSGD